MSAVSRTDAQQRVDDIQVFERELERLAREQVLQRWSSGGSSSRGC